MIRGRFFFVAKFAYVRKKQYLCSRKGCFVSINKSFKVSTERSGPRSDTRPLFFRLFY